MAGRYRGLHPFDAASQAWMLASSRRFDAADVPWLVGPAAGAVVVGHGWVDDAAAAMGGRVSRGPDHGLLPRFADLAGASFDPGDVDPKIVDFYENTSRWRMDLWSEWSPVAWPFGRAIVALWSQRLQQLSLPMRPLDVSYGMDSTVVHLHDQADTVVGSAWLRTMRKTGLTTYSGQYGTATLPGSAQPSVRVVFPLPYGSLPVFLTPSNGADGGLYLRSPIGAFGGDGAYLVLNRSDGTLNARRIPIAEEFHLYVDDNRDVRTDHSLRLWGIPAVRLHYRLQRE
ncbi:hypothetical protein ACSMXN_22480 [Jatrophihabitans sp. DSM 45814]